VNFDRTKELFVRTSAHSTPTPIKRTNSQTEVPNEKALWISNLNLSGT
jgi:hypothetical protein